MAQTFNNGESLASIRAKLNGNAGEIDDKANDSEVVRLTGNETKTGNFTLFNNSGDRELRVESSNIASVDIVGDRNNTSGEPGGAGTYLSVDGGATTATIGITQTNGIDYLGNTVANATNNALVIGTLQNNSIQFALNGRRCFNMFGNQFSVSDIGTTVYSSSLTPSRLYQNNGTHNFELGWAVGTGLSTTMGFFVPAGNDLYLKGDDIALIGNVGINKTAPLSKFAVVGLPTSSVGLTSGDVWRNGTVLNIIA